MSRPPPDLNEIAAFIRVAEHRSLTKAAKQLGVPKSTLSRRLTQLEERLGVRLLHRSPRNIQLTEAGSSFQARCGSLLTQIEDAESAMTQLHSAPRGRIRVSVPYDFGVAVCAPIVRAFTQRYPEVTVDLQLTDRVVDMVAEGFDVTIRVGPVREASLIVRPVGTVRGLLVASPEYLARHGAPREPRELPRHACIVFNSPPFGPEWTLQGPREAQVTVEVSGPLAVNSLPVVRDAAVDGMGIARLPEYMCARELADKRLVRVLPEWSTGERKAYAVYPERKHLTARVRLFLDFLARRAAESPLG